MADIAKRAGVSQATVSRVLNKDTRISAATSDRVMKAVSEFHYTKQAHSLKRVIAIVNTDLTSDFCIGIIRGVEAECIQRGYTLLIRRFEPQSRIFEVMSWLCENGIGGIVWHAMMRDEKIAAYLKDVGCPFVLVDSVLEHISVSQVLSESRESSAKLANTLFDLDKGPVAYLKFQREAMPEITSDLRTLGFGAAAAARWGTGWETMCPRIETGDLNQLAKAAFSLADSGVRCFFSHSSYITAALVGEIENSNRYRLDEFFFADFDVAAVHYRPGINSISAVQNTFEIGNAAMRILSEKQALRRSKSGKAMAEQTLLLPPDFVAGGKLRNAAPKGYPDSFWLRGIR
ncbi:MAG: LacI family DNA-binding transcriptional regulator [Capsulimonadaceae bacterium]|nr:LacI family DNA-binding transcriptional regulator [Capsulimonadaceae bacterium]